LTQFDTINEEEKSKLRAEYLLTLTAPIVRKAFEKDSEKSAMHRATFAEFVERHIR
jgi:hypothetical protein